MIEWNEYVSNLLAENCSFDGVSLSMSDTNDAIGVPPLIKASILMLDRMVRHQGKYNILVFPERHQSIFLFTLIMLLYNISEGRIERSYDPGRFQPGEKLRFGNAIVEFVGMEEQYNQKYMRIRLADLESSAPIDFFPLFQKTNAKGLSRYAKYAEEKIKAKERLKEMTDDAIYLKLLHDYKTHMDSSIVNMTSVTGTRSLLSGCMLCGEPVQNNILIGQADYEGNVKNIGTGQLGGTPAIVLASDLYAIYEMALKDHPIQSIIIDGSNYNALLTQMDALDNLIRYNVPITCVTDIVNSFDLTAFKERGFNIWRWDETSITEKLYDANNLISDKKCKRCVSRNVEYKVVESKGISSVITKLYQYRTEAQSFTAPMLKLFNDLYSLTYSALQETVPFEGGQICHIKETLIGCSEILSSEEAWISSKTAEDFSDIIEGLDTVYSGSDFLKKNIELKQLLCSKLYHEFILIIPDRFDKKHTQDYWQGWLNENSPGKRIQAVFPGEYCQMQWPDCAMTVIVGWLKRAAMRRVLYSFNTSDYVVLMYDCEEKWKKWDTARWSRALSSNQNRNIIERSFSSDKQQVSTTRFIHDQFDPSPAIPDDNIDELESVIRENQFRHYVSSSGSTPDHEPVEAIPVSFVGDYLAFYRTGHKIISASDVLMNDSDTIESVFPEDLKLGDFVVVREADRDLIRDIADQILEREGNNEARVLAKKWQEALNIEWIFSTEEELYQRMCSIGFARGTATLHRWLTESDLIAPQSKRDLEYIAEVTGDGVLKEKLDQIWDAAQTVKAAHTRAGRVLSAKLKNRIAEALDVFGDFDPFNIWEPIEMQVEGIGEVRVLKVIDIGRLVIVDPSITDRLLGVE